MRSKHSFSLNNPIWHVIEIVLALVLFLIPLAGRAAGALSSPPQVWIGLDRDNADWPLAGTARLLIAGEGAAASPGALRWMRFSQDRKTWTPWRGFMPKASYWVGRSGERRVFIQVTDSAGNVREVSTTVTVVRIDALYVDDDNTTGPWQGTLERPYRKIQEAIDAANPGRVIIVAPGKYRECVNFKNKNIQLRSADPQCHEIVKTTMIDGVYRGSVITFGGGESAECVLAGFTITRGLAGGGGGINGNGSKATIVYNQITENAAYGFSADVVEHFTHYIKYWGVGGAIRDCDGKLANNIIFNNAIGISPTESLLKPANPPDTYIYSYSLKGAALYQCDGIIVQNTIWGNRARKPCSALEHCQGWIANNIIRNGGLTELVDSSDPYYCAITDAAAYAGSGNIASDPRLADPIRGDFHLLPDSPCIDAGTFSGESRDIDGESRAFNGVTVQRGDGSDCDIGADEYQPREQALWIFAPQGGEVMLPGAEFRIEWLMVPSRAGTMTRMELLNDNGETVKAWAIDAPGGRGLAFKHLPDMSGTGFRLRAISAGDPKLFAVSPRFRTWHSGTLPVPSIWSPVFAQGTQTTVTWGFALYESEMRSYTIERDDAADFATPVETLKVSVNTRKHCFTGLNANQTYWYRVRGEWLGGLVTPWSQVTSCTQDSSPSRVWMGFNDHETEWPLAATARLFISARDPGVAPSGLHQMRFSLDRKKWSAWEPFRPRASVWVGGAGTMPVYGEFSDKAGNLAMTSTTVTAKWIAATYVDDDNTSGPWDGSKEHPCRKIQDAIALTPEDSTIIVAPGTYPENIYLPKSVVLRSADPQAPGIVAATIIDGQYKWRVVTYSNWQNVAGVLAGFTITHGRCGWETSAEAGAGINGGKSTICYNRIIGNEVPGSVYETGSIVDGFVYTLEGSGGAMTGCNGLIRNNIIAYNSVGTNPPPNWPTNKPSNFPIPEPIYQYGVYGAALHSCNGQIISNTFVGNSGPECGAVESCTGMIRNNIFDNSTVTELKNCSVPKYSLRGGSDPTNISGDPRLDSDWRLMADSPCIDAGGFTGELRDAGGDARGFDGTAIRRGDGSDFDIGADEYEPLDQALWVMEPAGGGERKGGEEITVHWHSDPGRAGARVWVCLWRGRNVVENLGEFASGAGGEGSCRVRLPNVGGTDHRIRVISMKDAGIVSQTPPFTMKAVNGVGSGEWGKYR